MDKTEAKRFGKIGAEMAKKQFLGSDQHKEVEAKKANIRELRSKGVTVGEIAELYDCTEGVMRKFCAKHKIYAGGSDNTDA